MMESNPTLEEKFVELKEAKQIYKNSRPKIQKVIEYLRKRNNIEKHFSPMSVSIGPFHHDNKNLKLGENYKLTWAAKYIQTTPQSAEFLHEKITDNIDELKGLFADNVLALANSAESLKGFRSPEEKLSWMLFVDGCFLLYILVNANIPKIDPEHINIKVDQLDDEEDVNIKFDQLFHLVMMDLLLLENQIPYLVLKLLWKSDEKELIDTMKNFLEICSVYCGTPWGADIQEKLPNESDPPNHLLDLQRKMILTKSNPKTKKKPGKYSNQSKLMTYRNIEDLTKIGIKLKSSGTRRLTDVDYSEGCFYAKLTLPEIVVDDGTATSFLNLIAYEMCPDFKNDYGITSFAAFMNSLIDHAEDVKKLRSKGILANHLGRDEEVADLFNLINTDLVYNPYTYLEVRAKIHEHRFNKYKIWLSLGYHTYFSNPWAIIGFIAAVIAIGLTFVQTWFSIFPSHK